MFCQVTLFLQVIWNFLKLLYNPMDGSLLSAYITVNEYINLYGTVFFYCVRETLHFCL